MSDYKGAMFLAEQIAREAGELILRGERDRAGQRPEVESTKSSPTDVVTAMDRAVEDLLRRRLAEARPVTVCWARRKVRRPGRAA